MLVKNNNRVMLSDKAYSVGKKLVQVYIPATSALYFGLANIWGLPAGEQVVGTLAVLATFIGVVLGISSSQYDASDAAYDGALVVTHDEKGKALVSLEVDGDPIETVKKKESITFKVQKPA